MEVRKERHSESSDRGPGACQPAARTLCAPCANVVIQMLRSQRRSLPCVVSGYYDLKEPIGEISVYSILTQTMKQATGEICMWSQRGPDRPQLITP